MNNLINLTPCVVYVAKNKAKFSIDIILKFSALSVVQSDATGLFKTKQQ